MKKLFLVTLIALIPAGVTAHEEPNEAPDSNAHSVNTNTVPWVYIPIPELDHQLPVKPLMEDAETGVSVIKIKYQAGFINSWHTHTTGHGMYVLDGVLRTHKGSFGPGEFVWFPEGERMFHGASDENDAVFIFITNKKFDIHYEQ